MGKSLRYLLDEFPKVSFLLLIGAFILFPMYMMIAISFMTPAQLERFPWFPLEMPVPEELEAPRAGALAIEPATLEVRAEGRPVRTITVPVDRRFYLDLQNVGADQMTWRVKPRSAGGPVAVAQYRAADVYAVTRTADGYLVREQPFVVPEGFTSLLPGLQERSLALDELQIVDAAVTHVKTALRSSELVERATDETTRNDRRRDAVVSFMQAERCLDLVDRAMQRAEEHGAKAGRLMVPVDEQLADARKKLSRAELLMRRTSGRIGDYYPRYQSEGAAAAETINERVATGEAFKVDQGEAVAVLLCDRPATITRIPGRATVRTEWHYEARARRPFTVRPLIDPTAAADAPPPGAPLAEMVATRPVSLQYDDSGWLMPDGSPVASHRLPGFQLVLDGPPPQKGETRLVEQGIVVARSTMPKAVAELSGNSLIVGLATVHEDGSYEIPPGNGRWTCSTYVDRAVPFGVRLADGLRLRTRTSTGSATDDSPREIVAESGDLIAQYYVNRRRVMTASQAEEGRKRLQWVTTADDVPVNVPSGFTDTQPPLPHRAVRDVWSGGMVLGELRMPSVSLTREDGFLVVRMSGSQWGDGQWEYPLDEFEPLEIVKIDAPQMSGDGPWTIAARTDDQEDALEDAEDELVSVRQRVVKLENRLDDALWDDDAAEAARVEVLLAKAREELKAAEVAAVPPDAIFEVRVRRRVTLDYVNQQWTFDGRPVLMWSEQENMGRAKNSLQEASKRLREAEDALAGNPNNAAAQAARQDAARDFQRAEVHLARVQAIEGFVPLSDEGEILSTKERRVIVEPGDVLARLTAEAPHESEADDHLETHVARDGDRLTVSFAHSLELPVRANVVATDAEGQLKPRVGDGLQLKDRLVAKYFTPRQFDIGNYREAWEYVKDYLLNTVVVAVSSMVLSIFLASLSAFVFARFSFPGKAVFYGMIIILLMIPGVLNLIPLYVTVKWFGLLNQPLNLLGRINAILVLVLPAVAGGQVMNVYVMRNNLETLAKDLFDAARIDGATNWQTYWHIAVPLSKPIMGTLAIFALLSQWNNFIWPWVVIREQKYMTVTAGLALLEGQNLSDYGLQMAGAFTASIPLIILFFFMMNLFIRGMQSGAIKA